MPITPLPTPPNRSTSPETFSDDGDNFLGALPAFATQANALAADVNSKQSIASAAAATATSKAAEATTAASSANSSATLASQWATKTGSTVASSEYSAKEYAVGTTIESAKRHASGTVATGSAKDWATKSAGEVVAGQGFSAKKYAADAATAASTATTKAGEAASSASSASASASTATTKAGEAASSATSAGNSASTATTKASEASASATSAANSASTATTKASEAAASAASALASANNAAASYDSFDDRYLGSKAADPTKDNDGQTLLEGALYWNTSAKQLRVWNGTSWQVVENAVSQTDVGSAPNQLPSNQHLGQLAFLDTLGELNVTQHTPDAREGSIWCELVNGKPTLKTKLNGAVVNLLNPIVDKAVGTSPGNVMEVGAFGLGANTLGDSKTIADIDDASLPTGTYAFSATKPTSGTLPVSYGVVNVLSYRYTTPTATNNTSMQVAFGTIGDPPITGNGQQEMFTRAFRANNGGWTAWRRYYSTGNTTVDPNGFIKSASPIVNLFSDKIESNDTPELASVGFERVSPGVYLLTDCPPLADEGWHLEQPRDRNGNVYHNVEWFYNEADRTLRIETYERAWDPATGIYENGAPTDIKEGRFIALRFADSESEPLETFDEEIIE